MAALRKAKDELRSAVQSTLQKLTQQEIAHQSCKITKCLLSMLEYQRAKTIGIYLSMPSQEASTQAIVKDALRQGKQVFVPYLHRNQDATGPKLIMDMVSLHSEADYASLEPDKWGIPTPSADSVPNRVRCFGSTTAKIDLMLMPGMAFDIHCRRLGHGKGFYDFFLARYHALHGGPSEQEVADIEARNMPVLVALALNEQILPEGQEIPTTSYDWPLDALISGTGSIVWRSKS